VTLTDQRRITFTGSEVVTPKARGIARRLSFWLVFALVLAIFVAVVVVATGSNPSKARLSATNPGPTGAEALVNVLRNDHVTVTAAHTLGAALKDSSDAYDTTLVLYDPNGYLTTSQLVQLGGASSSLVLIEPSTDQLDALAPSVAQAGFVPSTASADCDLSPAQKAGTVAGLGRGYRIISKSADAQGCLGTGGVHSLVKLDVSGQTVWVLGSTTVLTNGNILRAGNAALALGLIGQHKRVVWYLPTFADVHSLQDGVLPAPPWVFLVIVLLGLVALSAIFWRGRRFGAIVVERMPVFVKSNETAEGRARLYQKASARGHSLDALRIGTIGRLATVCGLPAKSTLDDVIGTVARHTGRPPDELRALLVGDIPNSDSALMTLGGQLQDLEKEVGNALRSR
jgi:hypothetical protein